MNAPRSSRDRQRGNSMLLALIVLSALGTLGGLTVISVQSSLKASTNDRSQALAMYAAESGGAATMSFLRGHFSLTAGWSAYVKPNNIGVVPLADPALPSNGALPGTPANLFSADQNAWYQIELYNNRNDVGFSGPPGTNDRDGQLIIRATGYGPQGSIAIIEWEVQRIAPQAGPPPPPWLPIDPSTPLILIGWHLVL